MTAITMKHFDPIEYIKKSRQLGVTQDITEFQAQKMELHLQKEISVLRYDTLKFIIWTGIGVITVLGGMLVKGFHWV